MQPRSETIPHPGRRGKGPGSRDAGYRTGARHRMVTGFWRDPDTALKDLAVKVRASIFGSNEGSRPFVWDQDSPTRSSPNAT